MSEIADLDDTAEKTFQVKKKKPRLIFGIWSPESHKRSTTRREVNADLAKVPVTLPKLRYMDNG